MHENQTNAPTETPPHKTKQLTDRLAKFSGEKPLVVKPLSQGKNGEVWSMEDARAAIIAEIADESSDTIIERGLKKGVERINYAEKVLGEAIVVFEKTRLHLVSKEDAITESSKITSQNVRKAANDLAEGLQRIEKLANFDRLERNVQLLERAAAALTTLAELEKNGKLAGVVSAMR